MKKRCSLLAAAVSLTLFFALLGCFAAAFTAASGEAASQVNAVEPIQAAAAVQETSGYLIRTVDDEVCVFQGDALIRRTGVTASLLPRQDREALEHGISVESRAELTALLEDLGS